MDMASAVSVSIFKNKEIYSIKICIRYRILGHFLISYFLYLVSISCDQTTNENITYILGGDEFMDSDASCQYKVCKCTPDICRIKLEFNVS